VPSVDIGQLWNESSTLRDPGSGRQVRRLSSRGRINQTPTYHTNSGFTAAGETLVFVSVREGATWLISAEVASGNLRALWRAPGVGDRNYIHRGMGLEFADVDGRGVCGNRVCVAPRSRQAVFTCERRILAVDMATCEPRVLLEDCGEEWIYGAPCVSPDEAHVAIALSSAHPQLAEGHAATRGYRTYPDHDLRLISVPLSGGGDVDVLLERQRAQSAHCAFCPTDGNLLYFDLDLPPEYWGGGDGRTPRIWLLDLDTRVARPLKQQYPGPFQTHQAWLWDGSGMAYHGRSPDGGIYIGVAAVDGTTVWERTFPDIKSYGHLTPDARQRALILDGDFSRDALQWLHWGTEEGDRPRLELIARHGTEWGSVPGQYSHPHPLTDPSGSWISYTAARDGRTDVFVVDVSERNPAPTAAPTRE